MKFKDKQLQRWSLAVMLTVLTFACANRSEVAAADDQNRNVEVRSVEGDQSTTELEKLLSSANWQAVNEAKRLGKPALAVIRRFAKDQNFTIRQISMSCVEAIGDTDGSDILITGLSDENTNVRLAAAKALSARQYPAAADAILKTINDTSDEVLRELLVKAAGFYPGSETVTTLMRFVSGDSSLANTAVLALAKIGNETGRKLLLERLSASLPRTRYEALEGLCYVDDKRFVEQAKKLLSDKAVGLRIGSARNPKYRKVADQAVDALVCLLKLSPGFEISSERIYTDGEIASVRSKAR